MIILEKNTIFHHFFVSTLGPSRQNMGNLSTFFVLSHKSTYNVVSTPLFFRPLGFWSKNTAPLKFSKNSPECHFVIV